MPPSSLKLVYKSIYFVCLCYYFDIQQIFSLTKIISNIFKILWIVNYCVLDYFMYFLNMLKDWNTTSVFSTTIMEIKKEYKTYNILDFFKSSPILLWAKVKNNIKYTLPNLTNYMYKNTSHIY